MSTTLLRDEFDSRLLRDYFLDHAFDEMFAPGEAFVRTTCCS